MKKLPAIRSLEINNLPSSGVGRFKNVRPLTSKLNRVYPVPKPGLFFSSSLTFFLFTIILCAKATPLPHAIYIGIIDIDHPLNKDETFITLKIFQDDLKDAIKNTIPDKKIKADVPFFDTYKNDIEKYFQKHLNIEVNQQSLFLILEKGQQEGDVFYLHLKAKCPENWKGVKVKADFLMELFPTQSNILYLKNGENKQFGRMTQQEKEVSLVL